MVWDPLSGRGLGPDQDQAMALAQVGWVRDHVVAAATVPCGTPIRFAPILADSIGDRSRANALLFGLKPPL